MTYCNTRGKINATNQEGYDNEGVGYARVSAKEQNETR